jgi:hypothetical protein
MKPISPIITERYRTLVLDACEYLTARQEELKNRYGLSTYRRYDWDQDEGTIVFSNGGMANLLADIHFVGSVSARTNTWLWSWANRSVSCRVSHLVREVRQYGELHGLAQLIEPYWSAGEVEGWEMTSVSAYLLKTQGAYRTPDGSGFTYMLLTDVRRAT